MVKKSMNWLLCAAMVTLMGCASGGKGLERPLNSDLLSDSGERSNGITTPPMVPIYYNLDSAGIRNDQVERLEYNADHIKKTGASVVVEGNTDPQGTGEYNMTLGEKRAQSARKYLIILGVDPNQLNTVSYGEENLQTDDPADYVLDRRSDFVAQ